MVGWFFFFFFAELTGPVRQEAEKLIFSRVTVVKAMDP